MEQGNIASLEDVDAALKDFYDEAVRGTGQIIRDRCENKLITSGTRGIIHQESSLTGALSNKAVSVLEKSI
jgi:hypothetical protein